MAMRTTYSSSWSRTRVSRNTQRRWAESIHMGERTYAVEGMSCTGCESTVETALEPISGIQEVTADHETNQVTVALADEISDDEIRARIAEAGYEPI